MIWGIILHNLVEAHGELEDLRQSLRYLDTGEMPEEWRDELDFRKRLLSRLVMAVQVAHIYHHVNWAWNCRNADESRAIRCNLRDFRRWGKFPKEWPELWLPPGLCRRRFPKWQSAAYRWKLDHLTAMRIAIERAERTLGRLVACVAMRVGGESQAKWGMSERFAKCAEPITEEMFARKMRHLYTMLNEAWNSRKLNLADDRLPSSRRIRYLRCFPREFPEMWSRTIPKRKRVRGKRSGGDLAVDESA